MAQWKIKPSSLAWIAFLLPFAAALEGCIPKRNDSAGSSGRSSAVSDSFNIATVRVGPASAYNAEIYNGNYYSKYNPVVISGPCQGKIQKVLVQDTPSGGSTSSQTVACSNGTFSWTKSYSTQKEYALVLTAQDATGAAVSEFSPISKTYTYDFTNPTAPVFFAPSMTTQYTITDGTTSITIVGQVLNETVKLVGPYSINLPLMSDPDGIHKNFAFNATVPVSSSVAFPFTAYDAAGNIATSTMTIDSVLNLLIPVAAQEIGGSHVITGSGMIIQSSVGFMSEVVINNNIKNVTGSAGIIGNF